MFKLVALVALIVSTATGASIEERMHALEQKMGEEIADLKAQLMNATLAPLPAGALLTFVDGRTVCPYGTIEANITSGMMLVGRPKNGKTGAVFNRPFDAGEIGRTPAHSHAVSVNDPGHKHVNSVNDPGHGHQVSLPKGSGDIGGSYRRDFLEPNPPSVSYVNYQAAVNKTGIVVDNLPAKSSIEVSIDANDAGEHYPLVYVLLCQKLP